MGTHSERGVSDIVEDETWKRLGVLLASRGELGISTDLTADIVHRFSVLRGGQWLG
jgi:hypothetical protein